MWRLNKVGQSLLNQYVAEMLGSLKKRIEKELKPDEAVILVPGIGTTTEDLSILTALLTEAPKELFALNSILMQRLIPGYNETDLIDYQKARRKTKNRSKRDDDLISRYKQPLTKLLEVFDYKGQLSENKDRAFLLTSMKGVNVCTYCNRQYIFTINKPKKKGLEHIVRPELDHWFCKDLYPLLSLSFYNLIPSCHICNSSVKGSDVFTLAEHIHPYLQKDSNPDIQFRPTIATDGISAYSVVIDRKSPSREDNTIKAFALDEIYGIHGRLEVEDLMTFNYAYSDGYLKVLFEEILDNFCKTMTKAEIYRMLFGTEMEPERFSERPLSKLKYDVLKYLHVI